MYIYNRIYMYTIVQINLRDRMYIFNVFKLDWIISFDLIRLPLRHSTKKQSSYFQSIYTYNSNNNNKSRVI